MPTSRRTPTPGWRTRRRYADAMIDRLGLNPTAWSPRWPATTATCCSTSRPGGSRCSGWSRPRTWPRPPVRAASARRSSSSGRGHRAGDRRAVRAGGPGGRRTTSSPTSLTSGASPPGLRALVKDTGLVTLEFPHLLRLIERRQYDTIYHEHFSYLSLLTSSRALATAGLRVVDVDELDTHGGSLRVLRPPRGERRRAEQPGQGGARRGGGRRAARPSAGHDGFAAAVLKIKSDLLGFLLTAAREGAIGGGLWRPRQGQHAAQPLRHPVGPAVLHRGPQPGEAGDVPAGDAHPDLRARAPGRDAARLHPRPAVEPPGRDQPSSWTTSAPGAVGWSSRSPALEIV